MSWACFFINDPFTIHPLSVIFLCLFSKDAPPWGVDTYILCAYVSLGFLLVYLHPSATPSQGWNAFLCLLFLSDLLNDP